MNTTQHTATPMCQECGRIYDSADSLRHHIEAQDTIREEMGDAYLGHRSGGKGVIFGPSPFGGFTDFAVL